MSRRKLDSPQKTALRGIHDTSCADMKIDVPVDRKGEFELQVIKKY